MFIVASARNWTHRSYPSTLPVAMSYILSISALQKKSRSSESFFKNILL